MKKIIILLLFGSVFIGGCFHAKIINSKAPGKVPSNYDEKWHHGFFWGIAEVSGPYDLDAICPNGWAEVKTHTSFVNGFVQGLTGCILGPLYNPQTVSIRCAAGMAMPAQKTKEIVTPASVQQTQENAQPVNKDSKDYKVEPSTDGW